MRGSPKGASKSGGMDFEEEGRQEEVQKERERAEDWTLRRRGDVRKSKTQVGAQERKTRHHKGRRTDAYMYSWRGLVSGRGQGACKPCAGNCNRNSTRS